MQNETQIFPPKEVAMELKRVGFDWGCIAWYSLYDRLHLIAKERLITNSEFILDEICSAPTYDQVIGWFAEVHGIHILNITDNGTEYGWGILQKGQDLNSDYITSDVFTDRQQSLLTAFRDAIKLIEK